MKLHSGRSSLAVTALVLALVVLGVPGMGAAASSGSISGRVLDESHNALAGICVNVPGEAPVVTDADGNYVFPGLGSGGYTVEYTDCRPTPEYLHRWYLAATEESTADKVTVVDGNDTQLQDVSLDRGVAVSGTVTDSGGAPLASVAVNVHPTGSGPSTGTQTAPDGTYTTELLAPGSYTVQFASGHPQWVQQYWKDKPSYNAADPLMLAASDGPVHGGIDARLAAGATIQGTVTGTGGVPLASVCVDANVPNGSGWDGVGGTSTGPDGTYTLGSLPAADVRVRFSPCGGGAYIEQWYHDQQSFDSSTPVVLTSGEVRTGVDAQLHTGTQVSGTVTDRNGAPIQYVNVNVNPDGSGPSASGQTDADGHYTTGALPPGNYRVQFQVSGGFAPQFWNDQPSWNNADLLPIPPGGAPIGGINAALDTAASISGHVTSPDGHDAGNVCVVANIGAPRGFDWVGSTTTAADGTYTLSGLPPGAIKVQFLDCNSVGPYLEQWWNGQTDPSSADDVALTPGQARTGIDAHLVAAAQIRGTVTNGSGQPRSGICAQATTATFVGGLATTDAQGHYAITLARAGDYRVQFVDCNQTPTYAGQWWHGQSSPATAAVVMVGTGQVVSGIDAVLVPGAVGSISGKVTAARGVGMPTACVIAYLPTQFAVFGAVQPDGSYEIPNVPSGTYAIAFLGCDGGEPQGIVADPVVPGVTYPGAWWHDVPLDITGTSNGGPDPIAQGANLVTVNPGAHLTGIDNCFGCGAITIDSITPGADDLTVAFGTPILSAHLAAQARRSALAAGVDAAYTLSCSSGSGEAAHTATGSEKELTVTGLTAGATYGCGLIAEVDGTLVATSVDFSAVIPRDASDSGSSGSGRGGSDEPSRFMATTGVTSSLPAARMGVLFVLIGLVLIGATRRSSRTAAETP